MKVGRCAVGALMVLSLAACGGAGGGGGAGSITSAASGSSAGNGSGSGSGTSGGSGGGGGGGSGTAATYTIGGTISGLSASGLVMADNGGDDLQVPAGATSFTYATRLGAGDGYAVTVATQPTGEICAVGSGSVGTVSGNVSVAVSCTVSTFSISGNISGLSAAGLRLQYYSAGPVLPVGAGATTFAFSVPAPYGTAVSMDVVAQPYWQWCTPGSSNFSGPITRNITADELACSAANAHVTTLAGSTTAGDADGTGSAARLNSPSGVAVDSSGDVFVADAGNGAIRKVSAAGVVTTLATSLNSPEGVAVDSSGTVYVADTNDNEIREISPSGAVTTLAGSPTAGHSDGTGAGASFNNPYGVAVDSAGDVFVADTGNNEIRMITPTGAVTTLAGSTSHGSSDGTGSSASFFNPTAVAVDSSGNVYVADFGNNEIREVTSAGVVTTLAGSTAQGSADGSGSSASFYNPSGVAVDSVGNVFVADTNNNEIRRVTPAGVVTTLAGSTTAGSSDGTGPAASFKFPFGIGVALPSGVVYTGDFGNNEIRALTPGS